MSTLSEDLRELADLIDAHPELGLHFAGGKESLYMRQGESFADSVRALTRLGLGPVAKERSTSFMARVMLNPSVELIALDYDGEVACELVQVGEREVERPIMKQVGTETVVEPIMEWKCPESILASAS